MKNRNLVLLSLVTLAVVAAASMMSRHRAPETSLQKQYLFPGLLERINDVSSVNLTRQGTTLSLRQVDNRWLIEQADNYPADFGKIRETVINVAELLVLAEKTSDAGRYARLGVEDPAAEDADSLLLSLHDSSGKAMATLIVGKQRHSKSAADKAGLYVRLPDTTPALLVEGRLDIKAETSDWFQRELFDIEADRIRHIAIDHPDDSRVILSREAAVDTFKLENVGDGREMQSEVIISRMGTLLEDVFVDNVIKADRLDTHSLSTTVVQTFDGLKASIDSTVIDGVNYARFAFSVAENAAGTEVTSDEQEPAEPADKPAAVDVAAEATKLNQALSGWAYAIPPFKFELFTRKMADLTREKKPPDAAVQEPRPGTQ